MRRFHALREACRRAAVQEAHTRTIKTLGWWCTKCGEGILAGDALRGHEKAFLEFKAEIDEILSPSEVAAVREKLGFEPAQSR